MSRYGTILGPGQARLQRIAAGWTDVEMMTVRNMAADGAPADEIGAACGKSAAWAKSFIRRNRLVWNHVRGDVGRHVVLSASSMGAHLARGHQLRGGQKKLMTADQRAEAARLAWATRRANGNAPPAKANAAGMLDLILRLHVEGVLSEGQVQAATGLDRVRIRQMVDAPCEASAA